LIKLSIRYRQNVATFSSSTLIAWSRRACWQLVNVSGSPRIMAYAPVFAPLSSERKDERPSRGDATPPHSPDPQLSYINIRDATHFDYIAFPQTCAQHACCDLDTCCGLVMRLWPHQATYYPPTRLLSLSLSDSACARSQSRRRRPGPCGAAPAHAAIPCRHAMWPWTTTGCTYCRRRMQPRRCRPCMQT